MEHKIYKSQFLFFIKENLVCTLPQKRKTRTHIDEQTIKKSKHNDTSNQTKKPLNPFFSSDF